MSRISDYLSAVTNTKAADADHATDTKTWNKAMDKSGKAYRDLTRSDCARLWPGSAESKDPSRRR